MEFDRGEGDSIKHLYHIHCETQEQQLFVLTMQKRVSELEALDSIKR